MPGSEATEEKKLVVIRSCIEFFNFQNLGVMENDIQRSKIAFKDDMISKGIDPGEIRFHDFNSDFFL